MLMAEGSLYAPITTINNLLPANGRIFFNFAALHELL